MTNFVHCRGCGEKIHETAPTCPKCGAPQLVAPAATVQAASAVTGAAPAPSAYGQVPWFRRRWFIILCLLTITPIAGMLALTGDLFYNAKGVVKPFPKNFKLPILLLSVAYVVVVIAPGGSSFPVLFLVAVTASALIIGFKR